MHAMNWPASEYSIYKTMQCIDCCCLATEECEIMSCVHAGIPCIALPWKHFTKFKLHQLVNLLQIQHVNVFCEMQQLRLRHWNFIT